MSERKERRGRGGVYLCTSSRMPYFVDVVGGGLGRKERRSNKFCRFSGWSLVRMSVAGVVDGGG
jgi:hypothetical protein